jgi:predicted transcriptional regulator
MWRDCEATSGSRRDVTFDNWFSSCGLAEKVLEDQRLAIVGTLRKNRRQSPTEFLIMRGREVKTSRSLKKNIY